MSEAAVPSAPAAETGSTNTPIPQSAEQAETERRLHKVVVDGQELEVDDDELRKGYQLRTASQKRFQEAAQKYKEIEEFTKKFPEAIKQNPKAVFEKFGIDFRTLAEDYLYGELEREKMSPERRELEEYKAREAQREREAQEREAREQEERLSVEAERAREQYEKSFVTALESQGLPRTTETVRRMAHATKLALDAGYDLSVEDAARAVRESFIQEQQELYGTLEGSALLSALGEPLLKKIRAAEIARIRGKTSAAPTSSAKPRSNHTGRKPSTWDEHVASFLNK